MNLMNGFLAKNKLVLIRQHELAKKLNMGLDAFRKLTKTDPLFPQPIKLGTSRQSSVFYVVAEVEAWIEAKKQVGNN